MMNVVIMRSHGVAHHRFFFHPEANVGTGAIPDSDAEAEASRATIPNSESSLKTTTDTEVNTDSKTH
jgi:hypothetical protein